MGIFPVGTTLPEPGTRESEQFLWNMTEGTCLEFTHNHGSETDDTFKVNTGNAEPYRGFGHIAMMTPDVYASCATLEANGKCKEHSEHYILCACIVVLRNNTPPSPPYPLSRCRCFLPKETRRRPHERTCLCTGSRWLLGGDY